MRTAFAPGFAMLWVAAPATAEEGRVDQLERLDIEAGAFEVELQSIFARENGEEAFIANGTAEYAVSDSLQFGVEVESESEDGSAQHVESVGLQLKWALTDPEESVVGLGIQTALVIDADSGDLGTETFLIAHKRSGPWDGALDLVLATEPGQFEDTTLSYAARLDGIVSEAVTIGIEAGGELDGEVAGSHFLGPVVTFEMGEAIAVELGAFAPLSEEAPGFQARLEVDLEF